MNCVEKEITNRVQFQRKKWYLSSPHNIKIRDQKGTSYGMILCLVRPILPSPFFFFFFFFLPQKY